MSNNTPQYHFRPENYSRRPDPPETGDAAHDVPDRDQRAAGEATAHDRPAGTPSGWPVSGDPEATAPNPLSIGPEPAGATPVAASSPSAAAPDRITPRQPVAQTWPGQESTRPLAAGVGAGQGLDEIGYAPSAAPATGGPSGPDRPSGPGQPAPPSGGQPHRGHILNRVLLVLSGILLLLVGLVVGAFALGSPSSEKTPAQPSTVTATATATQTLTPAPQTVTPPATTVTAPPETVTVTASAEQTYYTNAATSTSTDNGVTTGNVVVGESCSSFGDVAYTADGTRLTCTRPTVQDTLRWMQIS